jgi:hypothetical protein
MTPTDNPILTARSTGAVRLTIGVRTPTSCVIPLFGSVGSSPMHFPRTRSGGH